MEQRIKKAINALLEDTTFEAREVSAPNTDRPNVYKAMIGHQWVEGEYGVFIELKGGKAHFLGEETFSRDGLLQRVAEQAMNEAASASDDLKEIKNDLGRALDTLHDIVNF